MGSMSWFQMGLFELPMEMKLCMAHIPMAFLFAHWYYFWSKSKNYYSQLTFEKVIDQPYYEDDMRYENPKRKKRLPHILELVDINNPQNLKVVDEYCKLIPTVKRFAQVTCAISIVCDFFFTF